VGAADTLREHLTELTASTEIAGEVLENDTQLYVVLHTVPLPDGAFAVPETETLFIADRQYPLSALDMFWTDVEVVLPDGTIPEGAGSIESYIGRPWRRFSWHRNGVWNPAGNPLLDHFTFMEARFALEVRPEAA
jgi:hypothetical protein